MTSDCTAMSGHLSALALVEWLPLNCWNLGQLLAASLSLNGATKELTITGTTSADIATVEPINASSVRVTVITGMELVEQTFANADVAKITFNSDAGDDRLTNTTDRPVSMSGGDGADSLIGGVANDTLSGGLGNDSLNGGGGDDQGFGGDGNDILQGGSSKDSLLGEAGNDIVNGGGFTGDTVSGGLGDDTINGGSGIDAITEINLANYTLTNAVATGLGNDTIVEVEQALLYGDANGNAINVSGFGFFASVFGNGGADTLTASDAGAKLYGGAGRDLLLGGGGVDQLFGQGGSFDTLRGGLGNDKLDGGTGNDLLEGGGGNDQLLGDQGNDTARGELGNDSLVGGEGNDLLDGSDGDDQLVGGIKSGFAGFGTPFDDILDGGNGNDDLWASLGRNLILAGAGNDRMFAGGTTTVFGGLGADTLTGGSKENIVAFGESGDDSLTGGSGNDSLEGGDGNDALTGWDGLDSLFGGAGNDSLRKGGNGWDAGTLIGNDGNDTLMGAYKNDSLDGGTGSDILVGNFGNDVLRGGTERDVLIGGHGSDLVDGGAGDDLVTGAYYKHQSDAALMKQLWTKWNSASSYVDRVTSIESASFAGQWISTLLPTDDGSLRDDHLVDTVLGGEGQDYFGQPGSRLSSAVDQLPDWLPANENVNTSPAGADAPGFFPDPIEQPGYLETLLDPEFGTPITRITDDPGLPLELQVNSVLAGPRFSEISVWSDALRTRYVVDSAWNVDGSLLMLRSYDPAAPYHLLLDGQTYEPLYFASQRSSNYRWSQNPAKPTIQYAFPQSISMEALESAELGTTHPLPNFKLDDYVIVPYDVTTNVGQQATVLPFYKLFSPKTSIAFRNGHEYVAMCGVDRRNPNSGISAYVVDLDSPDKTNPIVFSIPLTTADSGTPEATFSDAIDFQNLWFSPDGKHILVCYGGSSEATRSWRLLDVNYDTRSITPHVIPNLTADDAFQTNGDRTQGHFPVNWSHPTFALGPNGSDVYVVGVSGQFNKRSFPQNEVTTHSGVAGSVLAVNVTNNTFHSLTEPTNENLATHVTATNTQNPGYVFVSYWNDLNNGRGSKYAGEIVAINLANPFSDNGTIELVHHRTNIANDFYHGNTLPNVSPDGRRLIFSSTWGTMQDAVSTYVLDLTSKLP